MYSFSVIMKKLGKPKYRVNCKWSLVYFCNPLLILELLNAQDYVL